jgi:hypothetical protein
MNIETFNKLIAKREQLLNGNKLDKFIIKSLEDIDTKNQIKAIDFIQRIHDFGIPLDKIDTVDFESNYSIKVYIGNKPYKRFSDYDFYNAIRNIKIPY